MKLNLYTKRGFTLIELITAVSIFLIIMTVSMGSILGVFDANRRSRSLKNVMSNLNLAVDSMSREMRYGRNYHCGSTGNTATPQNCVSGEDFMSFLSSDNTQITYRYASSHIEKSVDGGGYLQVTAPEVVIDELKFYALGTATSDTLQPKVVIKITGHSGVGRGRSDFTLQTLVSQRRPDL